MRNIGAPAYSLGSSSKTDSLSLVIELFCEPENSVNSDDIDDPFSDSLSKNSLT